jgi:hypothetical protein
MNTPAHLLIGAAVMGQGRHVHIMWAAMAGALLPDLSLYVMAGVSLFLLQIPPDIVFRELYYSSGWQTVFAIDNSFLIWGLLFGFAIWRSSLLGMALTGAALLHLGLDFPLHHDDGRPHFWPLSSWVYQSPVSYWDVRNGARWIGPLEVVVALICFVVVLLRKPGWALSVAALALITAELMVARVWLFVFSIG